MKKFITAMVMMGFMIPVFAFAQTAQTVSLQSLYQNTLKQVIVLLEQELAQLETQLATLTAPQNSSSSVAVACTQEAKLCSDGSYVARSGSSCEFAACPVASSSVTTTTVTSTIPVVASSSGAATYIPSGISAATVTQTGKMPLQEIGTITVGASSNGPIELGSLKLTFGGNGYDEGSSTFLNTVVLKDQNFTDVATAFGATVLKNMGAGTITWTFPTSANSPLVVSSGKRLTLQLWGETDVIPGIPGISESLNAIIQNPDDLTFYDGADPVALAAGSIPLSASDVPIIVSSFHWGSGM